MIYILFSRITLCHVQYTLLFSRISLCHVLFSRISLCHVRILSPHRIFTISCTHSTYTYSLYYAPIIILCMDSHPLTVSFTTLFYCECPFLDLPLSDNSNLSSCLGNVHVLHHSLHNLHLSTHWLSFSPLSFSSDQLCFCGSGLQEPVCVQGGTD